MPRLTLTMRLGLDALMAVLFVSGLAFRATGRIPHEWIGFGFALAFFLHLAVNLGWCRKLFTGQYSARRTLNTATNAALLAAMGILCVTGVLNSRHIFGLSQFFDGETLRSLHSAAAYWGLVLIGVHTGLHWEFIQAGQSRLIVRCRKNSITRIAFQLAALFVVAGGIWASCDRAMGSKLFLGFAFDFWDPSRPLALFYAANFAIVGVYAITARFALKLVSLRGKISLR